MHSLTPYRHHASEHMISKQIALSSPNFLIFLDSVASGFAFYTWPLLASFAASKIVLVCSLLVCQSLYKLLQAHLGAHELIRSSLLVT